MSQPISRRRFVGRTALAGLVGAAPFGCVTPTPASRSFGARGALAEPGPMLPPVPAMLLTVRGKEGEPDEISVVWTFVINGAPPQIGISVGDEHRAGPLVELHQEFVLGLPTRDMVTAFDTVDMNSSRVADKFALSGLTRGRAISVDAPTVEEAPIHVECRVTDTVRVPPERTLFIASVVVTTALEGAADAAGRLDVEAVPFFGMTAGSGEFFTMGERVGHIGMTVGRDDIKY